MSKKILKPIDTGSRPKQVVPDWKDIQKRQFFGEKQQLEIPEHDDTLLEEFVRGKSSGMRITKDKSMKNRGANASRTFDFVDTHIDESDLLLDY